MIIGNGLITQGAAGGGGESFNLQTEEGDNLITEEGDNIVVEEAP